MGAEAMTRVLAWMIPVCFGIGAAIFYLTPAWGQDIRGEERHPAVGVVMVTNYSVPLPTPDRVVTLDFDGVQVTVTYHSVVNTTHLDSRDRVHVFVPDGYVAIPDEVLLPEGEVIEVMIYEAIVG
jgi:hypothetical protein